MALPDDSARPASPIRRLVHKSDFVRLLEVSAKERSAHFAIHHVASVPSQPFKTRQRALNGKLSTEGDSILSLPVDNSPGAVWLGCVVPKRHARRSVTRTLIKRLIRGAFERHATGLTRGIWLVRLRAGFSTQLFASAASVALADTARHELDTVLARASAGAAR